MSLKMFALQFSQIMKLVVSKQYMNSAASSMFLRKVQQKPHPKSCGTGRDL